MRARSLLDALEQGHVDAEALMSDAERKAEQRLEADVARLNKAIVAGQGRREELLRARVDLDDFRAHISAAHPELRLRGVAPAEEVTLPRSLRGGALVEFVVGEHRTIALAAVGNDLA